MKNTLRAGFCRLAVNPPLGIHVVGLFKERKAKKILDDITVSAVAFDNGETRAVIMSVDHLHLMTPVANAFRKQIAEYCSLPLEAIFMHCTHTHGGPAVGDSKDSNYTNNPDYDVQFGLALRDCAYNALQDLKPAELSIGQGILKDIAFVRRYYMKDGTVRTNPPVGSPDIDRPVSQPYEGIHLIKILRQEAPAICIVNFGVHPCSHAADEITADYPHFVRTTMEGALPNSRCMFLTGFQGDLGCTDRRPLKGDWDVRKGYQYTEHIGRSIAGAALQICTKTKPLQDTTIAFGTKVISLPTNQENEKLERSQWIYDLYMGGRSDEIPPENGVSMSVVISEAVRVVNLANGPTHLEHRASAVRIGGIVFAGLPGEPFNAIGSRVREKSDYDMAVLCCCTNGGSTYYPTADAYEQGGYESRTSYLKKGGDDLLVAGLSELIDSLK